MKSRAYYILFFILFSASSVFSSQYVLQPEKKQDTVFFESDAKLEFIEGTTNDITGYFSFNPESPTDSVYGILQVDLRTLKTDIEMRDKDMREKYLMTGTYPYAYFELLSINGLPQGIKQDSSYDVTGDGYFYIHGVKRSLQPELTFRVSQEDGEERIAIEANFHIELEDFGIERPQLVIYKLAKRINLRVLFTGLKSPSKKEIVLPSYQKVD